MKRSENDTWDLASSVGATATMVAAQRALATRERLIDDRFAEPLVRAVGADFPTRILDGEVDFDQAGTEFTRRFAAETMAVRTRYFDQLFTDAASAGIRQAVILAAGLDARAQRLPWPSGTVVFEVDQPEVIDFKKQVLADMGLVSPAVDHRTVGIDLRDDWPQALLDDGFNPSIPTAWIAEGLLTYLPPHAQDALFDNITELSSPGSRLATEHVPDPTVFSGERAQPMYEQMKAMGSDIEMGDLVFDGVRSSVVDYLTDKGWTVSTLACREAHTVNGFDFPDSDVAAYFSEMSYVTAALPARPGVNPVASQSR